MSLARDQNPAPIRFFSAGLGLCVVLGFLILIAFQSGYTVGKDIALRDNARDSRPWTAEKAAIARADCAKHHSGPESEAARKACLARIPFDGDWLTAPAHGPAAGRSPAPK